MHHIAAVGQLHRPRQRLHQPGRLPGRHRLAFEFAGKVASLDELQCAVGVPASPTSWISASGTSSTSSADQYTWNGTAPTVTAVDITSGPAAGGTLITVTGTNLNGASAVTFNGTAATDFDIISSTQVLVTTPALSAGTVDVTVTTPYGTSATSSADQYTALAAPVVTGISSTSGATGGGGSVTISGSGFTNAFQVLFGLLPADYTVVSDTSITATVPATTLAGVVDVTIDAPGGVSAIVSADEYTYTAGLPSVTAISPNAGPTADGTAVTISGVNLNGASAVNFASTPADDFTVVSSTQILATAPAGSGSVDITVTTPFGTSSTSSADLFTFTAAPPPTLTAISASSGPMAGGTSVTITGTGFGIAAQQVFFGTVAAPTFMITSSTSISVTAPPCAGTVDITVVGPCGASSVSLQDEFTYLAAVPTVTGLGSTTGPTSGGTSVNISGANLTGATRSVDEWHAGAD